MVPQEMRPHQVSDKQIIDSLFHNHVPPNFEDRIHPHRISSATTFPTDTTGPMFLLTGSIGEIGSLAEGRSNCHPTCIFDEADVDTFVAKVRQAIQLSNLDDFTTVYCHAPLKYYKPQNEHLFEKLFNDLAGLVDSGFVEYATQGEIYDQFVEWEQTTNVHISRDCEKMSFQLFQNYPNPFNSGTAISYQLSKVSNVELVIYNILGEKIITLMDGSEPAGYYSTVWDGKDSFGKSVSFGIYFFQLKLDENFLRTNKMIYQK